MGCKVNHQIEVSPTTPTQSFEAHTTAVGIMGGAGAGVVGWASPVPGAGSEGAGVAGGDSASEGTSEGMSKGVEFPEWSESDSGGTARKFDIAQSTASGVKGACWPMCQEQNKLRMDK